MFNKVITSQDIKIRGSSFAKSAFGSGIAVNRQGISANFSTSGLFLGKNDNAMPSWALGTGVLINTGGVVLFDNTISGGALADVIIANRGSSDVYIGFNNTTMAVGSGSPLATGESMQFNNDFITKIWAITASNTTTVTALGSYVKDKTKV